MQKKKKKNHTNFSKLHLSINYKGATFLKFKNEAMQTITLKQATGLDFNPYYSTEFMKILSDMT